MGKGTQRQNFQFLFSTNSYGGFHEETSVENRLKKYWGITKLRHFLWNAFTCKFMTRHDFDRGFLHFVAADVVYFSHEPPRTIRLRMGRIQRSKACGGSFCVLLWSALSYQLALKRSLGFNFTDWFATFFQNVFWEVFCSKSAQRARKATKWTFEKSNLLGWLQGQGVIWAVCGRILLWFSFSLKAIWNASLIS